MTAEEFEMEKTDLGNREIYRNGDIFCLLSYPFILSPPPSLSLHISHSTSPFNRSLSVIQYFFRTLFTSLSLAQYARIN